MSALAFSVESKANDRIPQLRKIYQDCVFRAVRSKNANPGYAGDTSEAIELAFQVCYREEREIVEQLLAAGMAPVTVDKALGAFKRRLHQTIRKVFGNL
jgi:hypothetical protein